MTISKSATIEISALEAGLLLVLGRKVDKIDSNLLAEALTKISLDLRAGVAGNGAMLLECLADALKGEDEDWKLNFSHTGRGEPASVYRKAERAIRDAKIAGVFEALVQYQGYSKDAAYRAIEIKLELTTSGVRDAIRRAKKRSAQTSEEE